MRARAVLAALLVLAAGASAVVLPATQHGAAPAPTPAPHASGHGRGHGDRADHASDQRPDVDTSGGPGSGDDVAWSSSEGTIPARDDPGLRRLRNLEARGDRGLAELAAQGWLHGRGTREAPYVIEGLRVARDLTLSDTAAYVVVRGNVVLGQLTLNWNGDRVHVHHNDVRDLRVNENVERTGDATGGRIEHNRIGFVGQLRHYVGELAHNRVGPKPQGPFERALGDGGPELVPDAEVLNLDGFHGARVHHNVVEGLVDIKLHGHHHGSSFAAASHEHARPDGSAEGVDHTERHHWLSFTDNAIAVARGPALVYRDTPHAADDRTASSEPNPELELPHVHRTWVELSRNALQGGGLVVRVFASGDERHLGGDEGALRVAGNRIAMPAGDGLASPRGGAAMDLHDAKGVALLLEGNEARFAAPAGLAGLLAGEPRGVGVLLRGWEASDLRIEGNAVRGAGVGLRARDFDGATTWTLRGNDFDAATPVDYDGSVANEPG